MILEKINPTEELKIKHESIPYIIKSIMHLQTGKRKIIISYNGVEQAKKINKRAKEKGLDEPITAIEINRLESEAKEETDKLKTKGYKELIK